LKISWFLQILCVNTSITKAFVNICFDIATWEDKLSLFLYDF
jgi:hypothetical protein